jgi:hypothetical protein
MTTYTEFSADNACAATIGDIFVGQINDATGHTSLHCGMELGYRAPPPRVPKIGGLTICCGRHLYVTAIEDRPADAFGRQVWQVTYEVRL